MQIVARYQDNLNSLILGIFLVAIDDKVFEIVDAKHVSFGVGSNCIDLVLHTLCWLHKLVPIFLCALVVRNKLLVFYTVIYAKDSDDVLDVARVISDFGVQVAFNAERHLEADFVQVKSCIVVDDVSLSHLRYERVVLAHHLLELQGSIGQPQKHDH